VLGAHVAGRAVEVCGAQRRLAPAAVWADRDVRRWLAATALAALAILVNPRGPGMLTDAWAIARNPNLRTVNEWLPLSPSGLGGRLFALSWGVLVVIFRLSRRRVRPVEALLLTVFVSATYLSGRVVLWYVPVYVYAVLPHVAEIAARWFPARHDDGADPGALPRGRSFRFNWVCLGVVWAAFALAPVSDRVLGGTPRSPGRLYVRETPRGIADYLVAHPPRGQVWNSQALGDWITWAWIERYGLDRPVIKLFTNTHMHLIPVRVWTDYQRIGLLRPGWRDLLDRYGVDTLVISKTQHHLMARDIRAVGGWTVRYEDENGLVVTRDRAPGARP
jgi:hypothetical protein